MNDSIWAVVAGFVKSYGVTFDYVLYRLSYANLMLYNSVLPVYNSDKKSDSDKVYNCDNKEEAEKARRFLLGY